MSREGERARAFGSLPQTSSFKAGTYHKNRKSQQKEKGSFLSGSGRKRNPPSGSRQGWGCGQQSDERRENHYTRVLFSLPGGLHTVVCAVKTPRSLEQDSPESEPEGKQPGGSQQPQSITPGTGPRPGLVLPRVQVQGPGRLSSAPGRGQGGEKRSLFGVEGTASEISIPHQLLPATNQPNQGAVSACKRAAAADSRF